MRKNWTKMRRDRRADIGIGTMIVFIAMVLVAAVAAAVLISTANQVREQATSTGDQAINNVATGFVKVSVTGVARTVTGADIDDVHVKLKLAAGSPDILWSTVVVNAIEAGKARAGWNPTLTTPYPLNIGDSSELVVGQGDLIEFTMTPTAVTGLLHPLDTLELVIIPPFGQPTYISFMVPETLIADQVYVLG